MTMSRNDPAPGDQVSRRRFLAGLASTSFVLGAAGGATTMYSWRNHKSADDDQASSELSPSAPAAGQATVPALDHDRYMRAAIAQARLVPELPFGAVLVDSGSGEIVAEGHNRSQQNPTFHGEIDVINRLAAEKSDIDWSALVLYTTAEPCPMCQSAIEWAGIASVVYGSSIPFLKRSGWWQIDLCAAAVIERTPFRKTAHTGRRARKRVQRAVSCRAQGSLPRRGLEITLATSHGHRLVRSSRSLLPAGEIFEQSLCRRAIGPVGGRDFQRVANVVARLGCAPGRGAWRRAAGMRKGNLG